MGRFSFNPMTVEVGFPVFPKGGYVFKVGEPKAYEDEGDTATGRKPKQGVTYLLKCVRSTDHPEMVGKPYFVRMPVSEDWAQSNLVRMIIAAFGWASNEEGTKKFRELAADKNWDYDTTDKTCGTGYHLPKEREVGLEFDAPEEIKEGKNKGQLQNGFPTYFPALA